MNPVRFAGHAEAAGGKRRGRRGRGLVSREAHPRSIFGGKLTWVLAAAMGAALPGCFREMSFPLQPGDLHPIARPVPGATETTRQWVVRAHRELAPLLEPDHRRALTTQDLTDERGRPRNVADALDRPVEQLNSVFFNYYGFLHTAQAASQGWTVEQEAPAWPGFEPVWIRVADDVELAGRLGFAERGGVVQPADCIVLLPGLWGDNGVTRTRDLAMGLREAGLHVLALELRGHGQTDRRFPNVYYNFGSIECQDLMRVSEWLEDTFPHVRRTGLVGFCWGGNLGMLAAWFDGRRPDDPGIAPHIACQLAPISPRRHYTAGVLAFSPMLRWEALMDETETQQDVARRPLVYHFQEIMRERMRRKEHPGVNGKLRLLIEYEYARSLFGREFPIREAYLFLRLVPYRDRPCPPKMESARVPVLIVHAANDMFASPQAIADLMAVTRNPNVAALILRGGGHVGFFACNRAFTYSLILNFFDPQRGPAAVR